MPKNTTDLFTPQVDLKKPQHIYTVSEITKDIKLILENTFGEAWVEGEVSNFKAHTSGHFYFTLKENTAILPAVMFSRANRDIKFKIENGLKLICFGKVSIYEPSGQYQIIVEKIEPKGIGSLQLALEQLKQKLEKEGLFLAEHKRPIPYLPSRIGVVTSLSGAAIKDILKVLDRRFSDIRIVIRPAQVQGEGAKEDIAQAIKELNLLNEKLPCDQRIEVMIVGRGGGSTEDLWAFNEEIVCRAIYNSRIPVISAVGHEQDWTISDAVADRRAPTPSVAAELVTPKKEDLIDELNGLTQDLKRSFVDTALGFKENLDDLVHRLSLNIGHVLKLSISQFNAASKKLALLNPAVLILQHKTKIIDLARRIHLCVSHFIKLRQAEFTAAIDKLSTLSPLNILSRGYSITFKMPEEKILKDARLIKIGDNIKTRLHKGEILSQISEVNKNG
jgi:exodeoxyribonuclease VII large subunit